MTIAYVDPSALAKRYLNEPNAEPVNELLGQQSLLVITRLTTCEMRSLLARYRRNRELDSAQEMFIFATFQDDIRQGYIVERDVTADAFVGALNLVGQLQAHNLRALDALHLSACRQVGAELLITCDKRMSAAAEALEMPVAFCG